MTTTEQREIDLVRRFADGTPLSPKDFTFGQANHLLFVNGGGGWALTEYGRSLLNGTVAALPPGDSASCPDEDSYWPANKALDDLQAHQDILNRQVRQQLTHLANQDALDQHSEHYFDRDRNRVIGPGTCNPTPPEASALDVQIAGDHYKEMAIQPVQFIEANNIRFLEGCIIKHACRHGSKSGAGAKDLRKIIHEAQLLLELRYGEKP